MEMLGLTIGAVVVLHFLSILYFSVRKPDVDRHRSYRIILSALAMFLAVLSMYGDDDILKHRYLPTIEREFSALVSVEDDLAQLNKIENSLRGEDRGAYVLYLHLAMNYAESTLDNEIIADYRRLSIPSFRAKYGEELVNTFELLSIGTISAEKYYSRIDTTGDDLLLDLAAGFIGATIGLPAVVTHPFPELSEKTIDYTLSPVRGMLHALQDMQTSERKRLRWKNEFEHFLWGKGYIEDRDILLFDRAPMLFAFFLACIILCTYSLYRQWSDSRPISTRNSMMSPRPGSNPPHLTPTQIKIIGIAHFLSGVIYRVSFGIYAPNGAHWTRVRMLRNIRTK